jgi:hypothetical protein
MMQRGQSEAVEVKENETVKLPADIKLTEQPMGGGRRGGGRRGGGGGGGGGAPAGQ